MSNTSLTVDRPSPQRVARELLLAVLAGLVAYGISCLLVAPGATAASFGAQWQDMSKQPLALYGQFPHRLLAPLLAYCLGFGGDGYVVFARGLHVVMLASVFYFCRWRGSAVVDALLITLAIAITAPVQMYKEHWVGYADPLCYTLFLWTAMSVSRPWLFWSLFFANLLNHELAAFLLPWLWFLRRQQDDNWRVDVVGAEAALVHYVAFYFWVKATSKQQVYNADYFFAHPLFPGGTVAVWLLAIVHWVVAFGPLLAVLAWHQHSRNSGRERWHLWLVTGCILTIFCIAFDWARHSNLLLLPLVIASVHVLSVPDWRRRATYIGLLVLSAALFAVPQWRPWSATAWPTRLMTEPGLLVRTGVLVELSAPGQPTDLGFGPLSATFGNWLPQVWYVLWPILLILAAIWGAGLWLARRRGSDAPSATT